MLCRSTHSTVAKGFSSIVSKTNTCTSRALTRSSFTNRALFTTPHFRASSATASGAISPDDKRAAKTGPVSPHVTIYRFPVPALTSITHRATGVALSVGTALVAGTALVGSQDVILTIEAIKSTVPLLVPVAKFSVAFPLSYHLVNGIRHLLWDFTLRGINTNAANFSSYAVVGTSIALSTALAFYSFEEAPKEQESTKK